MQYLFHADEDTRKSFYAYFPDSIAFVFQSIFFLQTFCPECFGTADRGFGYPKWKGVSADILSVLSFVARSGLAEQGYLGAGGIAGDGPAAWHLPLWHDALYVCHP